MSAPVIVPTTLDGRALVARAGTNESDTVLVEGVSPVFSTSSAPSSTRDAHSPSSKTAGGRSRGDHRFVPGRALYGEGEL